LFEELTRVRKNYVNTKNIRKKNIYTFFLNKNNASIVKQILRETSSKQTITLDRYISREAKVKYLRMVHNYQEHFYYKNEERKTF